jgi:hypothetical protein
MTKQPRWQEREQTLTLPITFTAPAGRGCVIGGIFLFIMSRTFKAFDFDEDHCSGQKIVERYNHTADYQEFVYIDENGAAHRLFGGSDAMINALSNLIEKRKNLSREATKEERELTAKALDVS